MATDTVALPHAKRLRLPLLPAAVAAYAATAALLSPAAFADMLLSYAGQLVVLPFVVAIGLPGVALCLRREAPVAFMREVLVRSGPRLLVVFAFFTVGLAAFTTFKLMIPGLVPFYADPLFADLDAALHFGNPGEYAHLLVPPLLEYPLGLLYGPVWFVVWFGLMAAVALHDDAALRRRYFWCTALAIGLLGTVAAIAFSSVGPVLYERVYGDDRFAPLMALVGASAAGEYMREVSAYLFENYQAGGHLPGTGISAMPSMHLAIATLNALLLARLNRGLGLLGVAYLALVLLGSVYLGWHYAIDGYVSIATVALVWWGLGRGQPHRMADPV